MKRKQYLSVCLHDSAMILNWENPTSTDKRESKRRNVYTLFHVLRRSLLLLPSSRCDEELWRSVSTRKYSIRTAGYPHDLPNYPESSRTMAVVNDVISGIRSIRGELISIPL
jgi:valyl-tRNA synthetase